MDKEQLWKAYLAKNPHWVPLLGGTQESLPQQSWGGIVLRRCRAVRWVKDFPNQPCHAHSKAVRLPQRASPFTTPVSVTRPFADHTNRANGPPLIKLPIRPPPRGHACYRRRLSACLPDIFISIGCTEQDATPVFPRARIGASTISPQHFPAYLPALPLCYHPAPEPPGAVKLGRASHVSLHCRCYAPLPSICLLGYAFPSISTPRDSKAGGVLTNKFPRTWPDSQSHGSQQLTP